MDFERFWITVRCMPRSARHWRTARCFSPRTRRGEKRWDIFASADANSAKNFSLFPPPFPRHPGVCSAPAGAGDFWPRPQKSPKGPLRNVVSKDFPRAAAGCFSVRPAARSRERRCYSLQKQSLSVPAPLPLTGENAKRFASVGFAPLPRTEPGYYGFPRPACGLVSE